MSTFLVIGDPHLLESDIPRSRLLVNECLRVANEKLPNYIVILGDVLDRHNRYDSESFHLMCDFLRDCAKIASTYVIVGNHDRPNNSDFLSDYSPFYPMHEWKLPIVIVDKPKILLDEHGKKFAFLPYVLPNRVEEMLSLIDRTDVIASFGHIDVIGAQISKTLICQSGYRWTAKDGYYIGGHNHEKHWVNEFIFYTGTPCQRKFGESEDKGLHLISFPDDKISCEKVTLNIPFKRTISLKFAEISSTILPQDGHIYRVEIFGLSSELAMLSTHPIIAMWKAASVKIVPKVQSCIMNQLRPKETSESGIPNFHQNLYTEVINNPELIPCYTELYPAFASWFNTR